MRTRVTVAVLLAGLFVVAGCATQKGLTFTGAGGTYAARTAADQIQVFDKDPGGRAFQTIGKLDWQYVSNTVLVTLADIQGQVKAKAAEVGGDAVIVRKAGYDGTPSPNKAFGLSADVIRWQP